MDSRLLRVKMTSSMRASSPIWPSEASLARTRERFASPSRRTCSQAKLYPKIGDWGHWIKRYELFEATTEHDGLSDKVRINALIYVMGNNVADIYESFKPSGEDIQYANVKQKFKDHFKRKVASVFERKLS